MRPKRGLAPPSHVKIGYRAVVNTVLKVLEPCMNYWVCMSVDTQLEVFCTIKKNPTLVRVECDELLLTVQLCDQETANSLKEARKLGLAMDCIEQYQSFVQKLAD